MSFNLPLAIAPWLVPLSAFCICWLTLTVLLSYARRLPMDHPNERSLHVTPTPRVGGIGVVAGVSAAAMLIQLSALWPFILGALALAMLSLLDDYKNLPVSWRLLAHLVVAVGCLLMLPPMNIGMLVLATAAIVWMTNLFNFMDGSDGLAGGMAVIGFGALAVAAGGAGAQQLALFCAATAAAALAFLRFNFPPARLFMGDAGAIPLGFLAAALAIYGVMQNYWPALFPLIVFSPFIGDASVTLIKRGVRGDKIWRAHREHYYQRLVRMGWSHRKLALAAYALMLACALGGLTLLWIPAYAAAVAMLWATTFLSIFIATDWRWSHLKHDI